MGAHFGKKNCDNKYKLYDELLNFTQSITQNHLNVSPFKTKI